MSPPRTASPAPALALALAAIALLAQGCANPLLPHWSDYDETVPLDRLRSVKSTEFDRFELPPQDMEEHIDEENAADEILSPYRGLERVPLSLEECRAMAIRNNLDLQVAVIDPTIANQSISEAEARFDSVFTLDASIARIDAPTFSELQDGQQERESITPGLAIPLRTGGQIDLSLPITRNETSNQFATLPESHTTDARISLTQSLLRNAGRRVNTSAIAIAGYDTQITEAQTKLLIISILARVDRTYWRLYQTTQELDVRVREFEAAKQQLERARRQFTAGAVAEVEVVRAESGLADRLESIIIAQNAILLAERELKELINTAGLEVGTETVIVPQSEPDPVEYEFDGEQIVDVALHERMELLEVELQLLRDALEVDVAENRLLPLLDLTATYTINGLGETLGESFRALEENRFEDWSLGIQAQFPLGNEAARSRYRRAVLTRLRRLGTREARELSVEREVYDAIDNLRAGWQRIIAARQAVLLNARTLAAEERQFSVGASTSTDVLDAAARLANAQSAEVRAIADYQINQVDLAVAAGMLLGANRVRWEPFDYRDVDVDKIERGEWPGINDENN